MRDGVVRALINVTLDVVRGEFIVIVGPNGLGKTALLNLVGGIGSPTGSIWRRKRCKLSGNNVFNGSDIVLGERGATWHGWPSSYIARYRESM